MIYKFNIEANADKFNDSEQSFIAWASKSSIDRQEEEIDADGWEKANYEKNPVVPLFHDYTRFPIAKADWVKKSPRVNPEGLLFKPIFAKTEIGQEAYYLYKEGFMNAFSVGFDPLEWQLDGEDKIYSKSIDGEFGTWHKDYVQKKRKKPKCRYLKQELLEISGVLVPAHPDALIEARGFVKTKELSEYLDSLIIKNNTWLEELDHEKPYPNEHACRLADPSGAKRCFRNHVNDPDSKKPFDQIICYYENDKSKVQALRYKKDVWTVSEARAHCKKHDPISFEAASSSASFEEDIFDIDLKFLDYIDNRFEEFKKSFSKDTIDASEFIVDDEDEIEIELDDDLMIEIDQDEPIEIVV